MAPLAEATAELSAATLEDACATLGALAANPEWCLDSSAKSAQKAAEDLRAFVKAFCDAAQVYCPAAKAGSAGPIMPAGGLEVDGLDREQVWEQMQIQNVPLRRHLRTRVSKLAKAGSQGVDVSIAVPDDAAELPSPAAEPSAPSAPAKKAKRDGKAASGAVRSKARSATKSSKTTKKKAVEQEGPDADGDDKQDQFFSEDAMNKFADDFEGGLDDDGFDSDMAELLGNEAETGGAADDVEKGAMYKDFFDGDGEGSEEENGGEVPAGKEGAEKADVAVDDEGEEEEGGLEGEEEEDEAGLDGTGADAEADELSDEEGQLEKQIQRLQQEGGGSDDEGSESALEDDVSSGGEEATGRKTKSLYDMDKRLQALEAEVDKLEQDQMEERPWALKGEVWGKHRPLNSLLETHLDQPMSAFAGRRAEEAAAATGAATVDGQGDDDDVQGELAQAALRKTTLDIDAIIRQRIWDETYDDVVKRASLPPSKRERNGEDDVVETLNFEKSRVGLGEVYAKQYEADIIGHKSEAEVREDEDKSSARALFATVMFKLDQLSNAHFTPRPPTAGFSSDQLAKVPSIKMEETMPLMMSNAALKAPEEMKAPKRHELEHEELNHDERAAERRNKKVKRRKALETKIEEGQMSQADRRKRDKALDMKNAKAKKDKAAKGVVKESAKRVRSSVLLAEAAATVNSGVTRKDAMRQERADKLLGTPGSKRLKL